MTILSLDRFRATAYFDLHSNKTRIDPSENSDPALLNHKKLDFFTLPHLTHHAEISTLHTRLHALFPEFKIQLMSGFRIVVYGYGTKISLLDEFVNEYMNDIDTFVVYAHRRDKVILPDEFTRPTALVVHNLQFMEKRERYLNDGMIQLIGSVNQEVIVGRDIIYHDFTTMHSYTAEELQVIDMDSLHFNDIDLNRSIEGVGLVLSSVTENGKEIFRLLARMQLEYTSSIDIDDHGGRGFVLPSHILFQRANEQLLVSNEAAFRMILTEFIDHEVVVESADGLYIPLNDDELCKLIV